jgi:hypothetical protein
MSCNFIFNLKQLIGLTSRIQRMHSLQLTLIQTIEQFQNWHTLNAIQLTYTGTNTTKASQKPRLITAHHLWVPQDSTNPTVSSVGVYQERCAHSFI